MPRLDLRIVEARNLPDVETFGKIDPYCTVELEGKQWRTSVVDNTENPRFDEVFKFHVADENSSQLRFCLWNKNTMSDDFLGQYHMSISGLKQGEVKDEWVLLQQCKSNAELHVRLMAVDFGEDDEETAPHPTYNPVPQQYQQPGQGYPQMPPMQGYPPQGQPGYPPQQQGYAPMPGQPGYMPPPMPQQAQYMPGTQFVQPMPGGIYEISPRHAPNLVVDAVGCGTELDTKIHLWERTGGDNQKWICHAGPMGLMFTLKSSPMMALDNPDKAQQNHLWTMDMANGNQQWRLEPKDSGYFMMFKVANGLAMDIGGCNANNGAQVSTWDRNDQPNQQFSFKPVQ